MALGRPPRSSSAISPSPKSSWRRLSSIIPGLCRADSGRRARVACLRLSSALSRRLRLPAASCSAAALNRSTDLVGQRRGQHQHLDRRSARCPAVLCRSIRCDPGMHRCYVDASMFFFHMGDNWSPSAVSCSVSCGRFAPSDSRALGNAELLIVTAAASRVGVFPIAPGDTALAETLVCREQTKSRCDASTAP